MSLIEQLKTYAEVIENESMRKHTTYRIGGLVDYYIYPQNIVSLIQVLDKLKENNIPYRITGRGSNLLWDDNDFHGAVINLDRTLNDSYIEDDGSVVALAGCSIISLAIEAAKHSLTGLEFASGIPGSIGGGIYMNAGAYKSDLSQTLKSVLVLKQDQLVWMDKENLEFGYRKSSFQKHKDWTILAAKFQLEKGVKKDIQALMESRRNRRVESQPLDKPCAGSVFRNPVEMPAWKIVEELGLRGHQIGGAQVSTKHCNFIINATGDATAKDVRDLIRLIQQKAKEQFNIDMITEVEQFYC